MKMIQKNIYTIYFYIGIVVCNLLLPSCGSGECDSPDSSLVFTNSSGSDIEIITYVLAEQDTFFVKDKGKVEKTSFGPYPDYIDSVKISFKGNGTPKRVTFLSLKHGGEKSSFNILDLGNYERYINRKGCTYYHDYTFTLDDYNNAK